jgi:hypothetical protein
MNIHTTPVFPPIPTRNFDWSAIDDDTYDASYDGEDESGHHWTMSTTGEGPTELDAVMDLLERLEVCESCQTRAKRYWREGHRDVVNRIVQTCIDEQCATKGDIT